VDISTTASSIPLQRILSKMFSRLNQFISKLGDEPKEQGSGVGGGYGFQVLRNKNNDFPLDPWFDFIIGLNGRTIVS
jgi:hypothetical protein